VDARLILAGLLLASSQVLAFDHSHAAWDGLLKKHVAVREGAKASQLRYAGMAQDRAALTLYLNSLAQVQESELGGWTQAQQMAFLINAYNAFTVQKILTRYPGIRSIWDFGRLFGNPFKDRFFTLLGKRSSLDDLEHETLRKRFREPRIHFALNCAAVGCPMLREEAYVAGRLERQLEEQAARFLSDRSRNRLAAGRLEVSKIFEWFREDFEPRQAYLAKYADLLADNAAGRKQVVQGQAPLFFLDYDWTLNDAGGK
jgi:hypothetical protein